MHAKQYIELSILTAFAFLSALLTVKLMAGGAEITLFPIITLIIFYRLGLSKTIIAVTIAQLLLLFTGLSIIINPLQ